MGVTCTGKAGSNIFLTTVTGLISKRDEAAYEEKVLQVAAWCSESHLPLNTKKIKEILVYSGGTALGMGIV